MSNPISAVDNDQPPYPSFEEMQNTNTPVSKSTAGSLLFWTLDSPFPSGISIMQDIHQPDPSTRTPYFSNGTFHAISQEPISSPKISSVTITVNDLNHWESAWKECHNQHEHTGPAPAGTWYGPLSDFDPAWDSDRSNEEDHRLGCCGETRPRGQRISITVKPAPGKEFVTVHDYVSTVHPRLMSAKKQIISARVDVHGEFEEVELMVNIMALDWLVCEERSEWIRRESIITPTATTVGAAPPVEMKFPVFGPLPEMCELEPEPKMPYIFGTYYYKDLE